MNHIHTFKCRNEDVKVFEYYQTIEEKLHYSIRMMKSSSRDVVNLTWDACLDNFSITDAKKCLSLDFLENDLNERVSTAHSLYESHKENPEYFPDNFREDPFFKTLRELFP